MDRPEGWEHRFTYEPMLTDPCTPLSFDERFPTLSEERKRKVLLKYVVRTPSQRPASKPTPHTYLVGAEGSHLVKIGFTGGEPRKRVASLQTGQPMTLSLLWSQPGDIESDLHQRFDPYRVRGEWFDLTSFGDPVETVRAAAEELMASDRSLAERDTGRTDALE